MADGHGQQSLHFNMDVTNQGIMTDMGDQKQPSGRQSVGFQVEKDGSLIGNGMLKYRDLSEVVVIGEGIINMTFQKGDLQEVTLKVKAENSQQRDILLNNLKQYAHSDNVKESTWIHDYDATCKSSIAN